MPMAREPQDNMGKPAARIDAYLKVTGGAKYAGRFRARGVSLCGARQQRDCARLDRGDRPFRSARGRWHAGHLQSSELCRKTAKPELFVASGFAATTILPLDSEKIWHDGQIVAMAVAETFEAAREAAFKVKVSYHR